MLRATHTKFPAVDIKILLTQSLRKLVNLLGQWKNNICCDKVSLTQLRSNCLTVFNFSYPLAILQHSHLSMAFKLGYLLCKLICTCWKCWHNFYISKPQKSEPFFHWSFLFQLEHSFWMCVLGSVYSFQMVQPFSQQPSFSRENLQFPYSPLPHTHTLELREERLRLFLRQLLTTVLFSWELCLSLLNDSLCWTKLVTVTVMNRLCCGMEELLCVGKWPLQQTISAPKTGRKAVPTVHTEASEQMCWPGHRNPGELVACGYVSPLPDIGMTFLK